MTFRRYLELIRKRWWVAAIVFALATITTAVVVLQQPWVYESESTFIVKPRTVDAGEAVRAIETLVRGPEISATFAFVAGSERVERQAKERLGDEVDTSGLSVTSDVITGRNAIEVTVRGRNPEAVHALAMAVSEETVEAVAELNDSFDLDPLDGPQLPRRPVAPNKPLTIVLGAILGLLAAAGTAIGLEFLAETSLPGRPFNIVDETLDVYNERYFKLRFREEISRARRGHGGFSVGVIRITLDGSETTPKRALRHAISLAKPDLRTEDVMAHLGSATLAVLMPNVPVEHAEAFMARWEQSAASQPMSLGDGSAVVLRTTVGVAEYDGGDDSTAPAEETLSEHFSEIL